MSRTIIVGGGVGGLALAFRLVQGGVAPADISVVEASTRWGGLLQSSERDGFLLEHGPDSLIGSKPAGLALLRDLGLEGDFQGIEPGARRALIARGGRLLPVPAGLYLLAPGRIRPFLASPLLSWRGKARALLDLVLPRRAAGRPEESLAGLVRRRLGREVLERIAQPLIGGISTADPESLSLDAAMPQVAAWEHEHRSLILAARARIRAGGAEAAGARYGLFVTVRGGLRRVVDALLARLGGVDLRLGARATGVTREGAGWRVGLSAGGPLVTARVALALPAWAAGELLAPSEPALAGELSAIPYAGSAILTLAFAPGTIPPLPAAAGFVVPASEGRTVLAATFMSTKYAGRAPAGHALLRVFLGGALRAGALELADPELIGRALADLRDLLGIAAPPSLVHLDRWPRSMAQFHLGHRARVARIRAGEAALPGLALIGNGYEGVGIPDVIAQADATATRWT
jgi:oxygen-dependent protoporphyrinogen oxidase